MIRADVLALPGSAWSSEFLEDSSPRRLVLEFYDREHIALRRYLSFLGYNPDVVQEVLQDTYLKLHQHLLASGDRNNLRAWLYRVAHNLAINSQKAFRTSRTDSLPEPESGREFAARAVSPEQDLLERERADGLRAAMQKISPAQRDCLVLRAQGLKYREIAEVLHLSVSTVGENVQRGLEKLKDLI